RSSDLPVAEARRSISPPAVCGVAPPPDSDRQTQRASLDLREVGITLSHASGKSPASERDEPLPVPHRLAEIDVVLVREDSGACTYCGPCRNADRPAQQPYTGPQRCTRQPTL